MGFFYKLWTAWCLVTFISMAFIFYPIEWILLQFHHPKIYYAAHRWPSFCTRLLMYSWGIVLKQHNKQLLKNLPQSVIVLNHRSDLDALLATGFMPGLFKLIGKKELEKYPFIGLLVKNLYITVDRSSMISQKKSLRKLSEQTAGGAHIVVFPEGWSNFSYQLLLDFKKGSFKTALDHQLPILVGTFINTHECFPKPKIEIRPGFSHLYWEELIPTVGKTYDENCEELMNKVKEIMTIRLKEHYPNGYNFDADQPDFETWRKKQLQRRN